MTMSINRDGVKALVEILAEENAPGDRSHRPICPECGKHSIVMFTPPKAYLYPKDGTVHPDAYTLPTNEKIDWDKAHLYCCNGETNCKFTTLLGDLGKRNVRKAGA